MPLSTLFLTLASISFLPFITSVPNNLPDIPTTGEANPAYQSFDDCMLQYMRERGIPGGSLAVVKDGRLVYARGYGWADAEAKDPVKPTSLFRIASISKPFTSAAIMTLVQDPKYHLNLDAPAFKLLGMESQLKQGVQPDPRIWKITIRQLLQHTGGWDRDKSGDPMFESIDIAREQLISPPAGPDAIIRSMMGRKLDNDPGTHYAYSNFGYCVLGRVIEKVTGLPYEEYVRKAVLSPLGLMHMRLGRTLLENRAKEEVRYYHSDTDIARSVFAKNLGQRVAWPYGGFNLEAMDAHGAWLASAVDLARFAAALDNPHGKPLLTPESVAATYAPPEGIAVNNDGSRGVSYYGFGWSVRPAKNGRANMWHTGALPGTFTLLVRRSDGLTWVALFNKRSYDKTYPDSSIDPALHKAANAVKVWGSGDLFEAYK
jgi:N-acyl-D-amino-acid deacylase